MLKSMKKFFISDFGFILLLGIFIFCIKYAINGLICPLVDAERRIIEVFIAFDIAMLGLVPVVIGHVKQNVSNANISNRKKRRIQSVVDSFLDDFCRGIVVWCAILLVLSVLFLATENGFLFLAISSFELAVLILWVLWICVVMPSNWPKTLDDNISNQ